jgi:RNA polymerase sigma factor (sigma-70 family)
MATGQMSGVIQHLCKTVLRDRAGLTDGQLLRDYLGRRDEAALAALVRRHAPMVWGVCRRVLHNVHDAEDAFQATFLVLVRKAASVVPREMLANWLYGVAHQTARKARATAARRRGRERQVANMPEPAAAGHDLWRDLRPLLDEELARLPDKYRAVLVLCDLAGKTRKEAARQLGCPEGTVAGRLARARAMLAKRLARQGLAVPAGALAAVLSQKVASAAVPASAVASTIRAASLLAAGQTALAGAVPAKVVALTEGVLKAMLMTKVRTVTTALLVVAAVGIGCGGLLSRPATLAADDGPPNGAAGPATPRPDRERLQGAKDDLGSLQGTWRAVAAENDGGKVGGGSPNLNHRLVIRQATLTLFELTQPEAARATADITLDTRHTPRVMVLAWKSSPFAAKKAFTQAAIYALDGDTLRLCLSMNVPGDLEAPADFSAKAGSRRGLWTFRRERPGTDKRPAAKKGRNDASVRVNERNFGTGPVPGVNADAGLTGPVVTGQPGPLAVGKSMEYKAAFVGTLAVVGEHFEQITHADQYDGRIEARTGRTDATGLSRVATVRLSCQDGKCLLAVRIDKLRTTGDTSEVVGRDADLERVILTKLNARQTQRETQGKRFWGAGAEGVSGRDFEAGPAPGVNADAGHTGSVVLNERNLDTGLVPGVNSNAVPAGPAAVNGPKPEPNSPPPLKGGGGTEQSKGEPKARPQGPSPLQGAWRIVSVRGGEGALDAFMQTDLVFVGERLLAVPKGPEDTGPATVYRFRLGARRPVQEIDLYQKAASGETRFLGVYEVRGDELRLCLSARLGTRAITLEPTRKQALLVARRIVDGGGSEQNSGGLGPRPLSVDFGFPIRRPDDAGARPIYMMRFVDGGTVDNGRPEDRQKP